MASLKSLTELLPLVSGKNIILRADLNVPTQNGIITDTARIDRTLKTISDIAKNNGRVIIISHFARPKGQYVAEMSLKNIAVTLSNKLGINVQFAKDTIGDDAKNIIKNMNDGDVVLLENIRFHAEEEENNPEFAKKLAALGDFYVNDAFSTAHRAHASTYALPLLLPSYAGHLMMQEVTALEIALENPEPPVAAIVGGAKISTKIDLLKNLVTKVDYLILGGGMANTFLYAKGISVGHSLCETDMVDTVTAILESADKNNCRILLPIDAVIADSLSPNIKTETCPVEKIPNDKMMLDIGPDTVASLKDILSNCKTVLWNGPMGAFEIEPFDKGTTALAQIVAEKTRNKELTSIAGGGDTVSALSHARVSDDFSYISTAGGAFLEWIEGKSLPGVEALNRGIAA